VKAAVNNQLKACSVSLANMTVSAPLLRLPLLVVVAALAMSLKTGRRLAQ